MVSPSRGLPSNILPVARAPIEPVCHQVQQQTATVCVTGSRSPGLGSGCTQSVLGRTGPVCLPTDRHFGLSGGEVAGLPVQQNNPECSRVAQHALVLGLGGTVQPDLLVCAQSAESSHSAVQPDPSQKSVEPEPACMSGSQSLSYQGEELP